MIELLEAAPTSAITEAQLERGYGIRPRTERCLCGASIRVSDGEDWSAIAAAVRLHNASTGHAQWALAAGWR